MSVAVENQNINVGVRPKLAAAIAAQSDQTIVPVGGMSIDMAVVNRAQGIVNIPTECMKRRKRIDDGAFRRKNGTARSRKA